MQEEWKWIKGYEGLYQISNLGNLKSFLKDKDGYFRSNVDKNGWYLTVNLYDELRRMKTYRIHRLVAEAFIGEIPKGYHVHHKDGNKQNNNVNNLEWVTARENMQHAFDTNLCIGIFGENSHLSKITNLEALAVCRLIMDRKSNAEISEELGISEKTIQHIRHGESWKSISKNFKFPKLGNAKPYTVNESKIHEVCKLLEKHKYSDTEISNMTGIRRRYITDVRIKKRRRDISDLYNIDSEPVKQISDDAIRKACKLLSEKKLSQAKIAKECSICQCLVSEIYNRKKYIDISKDYEF